MDGALAKCMVDAMQPPREQQMKPVAEYPEHDHYNYREHAQTQSPKHHEA